MNGAQLKLIMDKLDCIIELLEKQEAGKPDYREYTWFNGKRYLNGVLDPAPPTDAVTISKREL